MVLVLDEVMQSGTEAAMLAEAHSATMSRGEPVYGNHFRGNV